MKSRTIAVIAQWALEGKHADGEDYRILSCSTGDLTRANFADALSRFQLGELSALPQVSLSYARHGTQQGLSYLAFAIHWYATEGQSLADGVIQRDNQGRPTAYTSYFCLPYQRLADAAIGYLAIYEALCAVTLTVVDGPPKEVPIAMPTSRTPSADYLAMRVAPLLLTGRPVCVLGADATSMLERLEFIDTVMELLPYGFRSRMTAATWTRATNRDHRFRLFFSNAPRAGKPDHVVTWSDDANQVPVPTREASVYLDWLQDNMGPLARLADLTKELGFSQKDTLQALEVVLDTRHRFRSRPWSAASASNEEPSLPPASAAGDFGEEVLTNCAKHLKLANLTRLRSDISFLKKFAEGEIGEDRRKHYRSVIARLGLLGHAQIVETKWEEKLYDALLQMAFATPFNYEAYCQVEKCAGIAPGDAPHPELLSAIARAGLADSVVSAIAYWHLGTTDENQLNKWLVSGQVDVLCLIDLMAVDSSHPRHARIVCDVTLEYLRKAPNCYQPWQVEAALREHGFLAHALQKHHPDQDQYQVHALYQFLIAVYPQPAATPRQDLSKAAIKQILNGTGPPPTPALLSAVLMLLDNPESWQLAWNAYIHGSVTRPEFADETRERLRKCLPPIDAAAISAPEPQPEDLA